MNCIPVAALLFAASTYCSAAVAQQVEFDLDDVLAVGETEVAYGLDLIMTAASPTGIALEALLDLRDFQERLPGLLAEFRISDDCGSRTDLTEIAVEAEGDVVAVTGLIDRQSFECNRINETDFRRGAETERLEVAFGAAASASLSGRCLTFELVDLSVDFADSVEDPESLGEDLEGLRVILLEVARRFLGERPLCLELLPPELASLDPVFKSGGPREIENGGLGLYIDGSIDVSTKTMLDLLRFLQREEIIPGPP